MAGECRWQVQKCQNLVKIVKSIEFRDHIWKQHDKYFVSSTIISVIGSLNHEIAVNISKNVRKQTQFYSVKAMPCILNVKIFFYSANLYQFTELFHNTDNYQLHIQQFQ